MFKFQGLLLRSMGLLNHNIVSLAPLRALFFILIINMLQ